MLAIHKYANLFPMMNDDEYQSLKDDISKNGLLEPIWTYQGEIIDGRNRARACEELGIEPAYKTLQNEDVLSTVISLNARRRSLNETQRACVASKIANKPVGRNWNSNSTDLNDNITLQDASLIMNVSRTMVATVKSIERESPELIPLMECGEMTVNEAVRIINQKKEEEARGCQSEEDRYNAFLSRLGSEALKDAILAAAKGDQTEKELAIEFLKNGDGELYYLGAGYVGDYQSVIDWVNGGCQPIEVLMIQTLCGSGEPIREYCPPAEDDEDDILYDLKHNR